MWRGGPDAERDHHPLGKPRGEACFTPPPPPPPRDRLEPRPEPRRVATQTATDVVIG